MQATVGLLRREIDNSAWKDKPLQSSISPSFETCNIIRWYELRIDVGLGWGVPGNVQASYIFLRSLI